MYLPVDKGINNFIIRIPLHMSHVSTRQVLINGFIPLASDTKWMDL